MLPAFAEFLRGQLRMVGLAYAGAAGVAMASLASLLFLTPVGQVVQEAIRVPFTSISGMPSFVLPEVASPREAARALPDAPLAPPGIASVPRSLESVVPPPSLAASVTELLLAVEALLGDEAEEQADDVDVDVAIEIPDEMLAEPEFDPEPEARAEEPEIPTPAGTVPIEPATQPVVPTVSTSVADQSPVAPPPPTPPVRVRPARSEGVSGTSSTPIPEVRRNLLPTALAMVQPTVIVPTPVPPAVVEASPSVASTVEIASPGRVTPEPVRGAAGADGPQGPDVAGPAGGPAVTNGCGPATSRRPADSPSCQGPTNLDLTPSPNGHPEGRPASADKSPTTAPVRANTSGRVGVCHATGSSSQPFRYMEVEASAVAAHAAHGDRVGVTPDACAGLSPARAPSPTPVREPRGQSRSGR